jgi:hypothetical protein
MPIRFAPVDESVLGPNPFPVGDPRHEAWRDMCRLGAEEEAAVVAPALREFDSCPDGLILAKLVSAAAGLFAAKARCVAALAVQKYEHVDAYVLFLSRHAEQLINICGRHRSGHLSSRDLTSGLRIALDEQIAHWRSEVLRVLRCELEDSGSGSKPSNPAPAQGVDAAGTSEDASPGDEDLRARRLGSDLHAATPETVDSPEPVGTIPAWTDLKMELTSEHRVQITVPGRSYTLNYTELGFENRKTGKPKASWDMLRDLAVGKGVVDKSSRAARRWTAVEKRVQEIRCILRAHFRRERIQVPTGDPLPFVPGQGYVAQFRIGQRYSYDF